MPKPSYSGQYCSMLKLDHFGGPWQPALLIVDNQSRNEKARGWQELY